MKQCVFLISALCAFFSTAAFGQAADYGTALDAAIKFYDANRCGKDAGTDNQFSWRGPCHTTDGGAVDLNGGYHDAGDHVKFGLPQCWSAAVLGWTLYEYPSVFTGTKKTQMLRAIKWFTDYFIKCHTATGTFYYQVGDGGVDHGYWGSPEGQTGARPVIKAPPGSDVCAEAAAALALMSINYKSIDATYAQKCLDVAKDLWAIAFANCGNITTARCWDGPNQQNNGFYKSSSHYDDMCWAGIWMYTATGTSSYLDSIDKWVAIPNDPGDNQFQKKWSPAWDDVDLFVLLKMAEINGNSKYYDGVAFNLDWCLNQANKSGAGLPIIDQWGVLRYASAEAGQGYLAYKLLGYDKFNTKGNMIIDYCLGTNPEKRSYLCGWGTNPPLHPSHRANEPIKDKTAAGYVLHTLTGGLVGGPTNDVYDDNVDHYQVSEVALDYNASFILGLAGNLWLKAGGKPKNRAPSVSVSPSNGVTVPQGANITFKVTATDADGKVTKIELFKGDASVATATTSPLTYTWQNAPMGDATFKANATDDSGNVSGFTMVTVHVTAPCTPGQNMSRQGWTATASNYSPNAPEAAAMALDGDAGTRYSSGSGLSVGAWFQLDMGYPRDFDQIVVVSSGSDFPTALKAYATNDTASLGTAIASPTGAMTTTITPDKAIRAQYIRLVSGSSSGSWWSINEINVRCAVSTNTRFTEEGPQRAEFRMNAFSQKKSVLVNYTVPTAGWVTLEEFSLKGARMGVLFNGYREAGNYSVSCNTDRCTSNMVLFKINYKGSSQLQRAVVIK